MEIDNIDTQIVRLLSTRMREAEKVAQYKKNNNLTALQSERWKIVLDHIQKLATENNLDSNYLKAVWNLIHEYTLKTEQEMVSL